MQHLLKKNFWVVHVLVLAACALFAAKGTNHVIEAKYLLGDAKKKAARAKAPRAGGDTKPKAEKDDAVVISRNMFCSVCEPPKPLDPVATSPTDPSDPNNPPITSLPLTLLETSVSSDDVFSSATVSNSTTFRAGSYWLHEEIPDAGEIVYISPRYVDFHNKSANRIERLDLLGVAAKAAPPAEVKPAAPATGDAEAMLLAEVDKGVKKVDDTHYEIDRSLVDKILNDPNVIARSARIVPSIKDGKANGFKMYAIRPNSVYAKIGMQNGDTIHAINGYEITSPDKALEVYQKVKSASSLSVEVTRRGQPLNLSYSIK